MIAYASGFRFPSSLSKLTWSPSFLFVANAAFFFTLSLTAFLFSGALAAANTQQAVATATTKSASGSGILEVHIASDGLILLRNAQVVSVSGNSILVSTKWGSTDLHWTVHTNDQFNAKYSSWRFSYNLRNARHFCAIPHTYCEKYSGK